MGTYAAKVLNFSARTKMPAEEYRLFKEMAQKIDSLVEEISALKKTVAALNADKGK
jgi:hypothetical protein